MDVRENGTIEGHTPFSAKPSFQNADLRKDALHDLRVPQRVRHPETESGEIEEPLIEVIVS